MLSRPGASCRAPRVGKELFRSRRRRRRTPLTKVEDREALFTIVRKIAQSSLLIADGITATRPPPLCDKTGQPHQRERLAHVFSPTRHPNSSFFPRTGTCIRLRRSIFGAAAKRATPSTYLFFLLHLLRLASSEPKREPSRNHWPMRQARAFGGRRLCPGERRFFHCVPCRLARHPTLGKLPEVLRRTDVPSSHGHLVEHVLASRARRKPPKPTFGTRKTHPRRSATCAKRERAGVFLMNATPVEVVRRVAKRESAAKNPLFYPKVLTGLTIHTLEPDRTVQTLA